MQDKTTEIFRDAPVPKAVFTNIIPSIISMIMVLVYNLADTFFIGQTKNAFMVAAVSVATPALLICMAMGMEKKTRLRTPPPFAFGQEQS